MSLKIIHFPTPVSTPCPRPDTVGSIPYTENCPCAATINGIVATVDPTLTTAPAIAYRESHKNQYVTFGTSTYFIDMYANAIKVQ
jgi:hypothetical protein